MELLRHKGNIFESIKEYALHGLSNGVNCYGCDLHHALFNRNHFVIYHFVAKEIAERWELDAFDLIEYNSQNDIENFGECYWIKDVNKLNWESQVNLAAYWLGCELLYEIDDVLDPMWGDQMTEEDVERVKQAIEELEY